MKTIWQPSASNAKRAIVWQLALDLARNDPDRALVLMKLPLFSVALDGYDALRPRAKIKPFPGGFMLARAAA
ncbi:MAG TPA: hypothetical protein VFM98_01745 [Ramlibacter sp.]|uniref:hypothetical protein n=1 Tax=Ramlibacter sp. TaxID=1917967 RepID=UPI002D7F66D4|nr:hypothetical protein [Ramlibacter sp.]HET8744298.1 hypothetical protein [Ramlibacter sp.]